MCSRASKQWSLISWEVLLPLVLGLEEALERVLDGLEVFPKKIGFTGSFESSLKRERGI